MRNITLVLALAVLAVPVFAVSYSHVQSTAEVSTSDRLASLRYESTCATSATSRRPAS
jgi:hypothetical protein